MHVQWLAISDVSHTMTALTCKWATHLAMPIYFTWPWRQGIIIVTFHWAAIQTFIDHLLKVLSASVTVGRPLDMLQLSNMSRSFPGPPWSCWLSICMFQYLWAVSQVRSSCWVWFQCWVWISDSPWLILTHPHPLTHTRTLLTCKWPAILPLSTNVLTLWYLTWNNVLFI